MKVCKFGGTSMATAESIRQIETIIQSDSQRKYVVVSAPGKRFKGDTKVTDLLYAANAEKEQFGIAGDSIEEIRERFVALANELNLELDMDCYIDKVEEGINCAKTADFAASRGEYLAAILLAEKLGYRFIDAADIIKFKVDGTFDADSTNDLVKELKSIATGIVIPGFYGSLPDNTIKTFSRGGSDITGAIIARGVGATVYENWTDVNGFMITDPTIVKDSKQMEVLSYEELRELSYMGASVLHPDSIFPIKEDGIPINIRNTFEPENKGTLIIADTSEYPKASVVTGIAGRKGNTTISLKKAMMNSELGFGRRVLSVLERYGISFEHMPTGIDTMSIVITEKGLNGIEQAVINDIKNKVAPDNIEVIHSLALIAVVGHGMANQMGTAAKIFAALYEAGINVRMIDQGSSEMNIIIGVEEKDYENAIKAIYYAFFG
ncbi:MAG: aspartate kinase [Clostridia bacterium]|nr:aspartate kinase [Clostridia bacterium]